MVTYNIEMMQEFAISRGGRCLSKSYKNGSTLMKWQCKMGHVWENKYYNMKKGSWCPICRKIRLGQTIEEMQDLAKKNGGECLSKHTYLKKIRNVLMINTINLDLHSKWQNRLHIRQSQKDLNTMYHHKMHIQ